MVDGTLPEISASSFGISAWQAHDNADAQWLSTVETIGSMFESSFHKTAIFPLADMTFFDGSLTEYNALMS